MPTTLGGRYRLDSLIGGGGMGEVWRAYDDVLDRVVAIKVIRPHLADDSTVRERLRIEARLAGSLHHQGIVDVFDYGEDEDPESGSAVPFLVMPLIDGAPLSALLSERGTLSTGETMAVVAEVSNALQAAHDAGIVHRDLKPGNILVTPAGRVMLVDFGIAHATGGEPLTQTGALIGTADYLSPEQASGRPATHASDLYSLGVVAYACLTGELPFHRDSDIATALAHVQAEVPALPETLPDAAGALVGRLLSKEPAQRPGSAAEVAASAHALATAVPAPPGVAAAGQPGEQTMPDAAAKPGQDTVPGMVERAVPVGVVSTADAPTGPLAAAPAAGNAAIAGRQTEKSTPAERDHPRRRAVMMGSAAVAVVALLLGWMLTRGDDVVEVPNLENDTAAAARQELEGLGLKLGTTEVDAAGHDKGDIVKQRPKAGAELAEGRTVEVEVATGFVKIPDKRLLGSTYDEAVQQLDELGLEAARINVASPETTGSVIDVDPSSRARTGDTVTLTVAIVTTGAVPKKPDPDEDTSDDESSGPGSSGDNGKTDKGADKPKKDKTPKPTKPTKPTPTTETTPPDDEDDDDE